MHFEKQTPPPPRKKNTWILPAPTPSNNENSYQENECDYWIKSIPRQYTETHYPTYCIASTEQSILLTPQVSLRRLSIARENIHCLGCSNESNFWIFCTDCGVRVWRKPPNALGLSCYQSVVWASGWAVFCLSLRGPWVKLQIRRNVSHTQRGTCRLCIKNIKPKSHNCFRPSK